MTIEKPKLRVYLVGIITEDIITHEWRKVVKAKLGDKFIVDDPTATPFDKDAWKEAEGDPEKMKDIYDRHQTEILLPKSYQSVMKSDIILLNLKLYEQGHAGHIMELAWAWAAHKTIVAVKGDSYYSRHPMVRAAVHAWTDTVEEACLMIKEFYGSKFH